MAKGTKFLVLVGALIGIGAALLFFGSQAITSDIIIQEGQIIDGSPMQIKAELDPKINTNGVFAVQTTEQTEVSLTSTILDPNGNEIITNSIVTNSFEALFDITEFGTYTLLIYTSSADSVQIIGGIVYDYSNDYIDYDGYVYWDLGESYYKLYSLVHFHQNLS